MESVETQEATQAKPRTLEDVSKEYSNWCAHAGQIQYQVFALNKDLNALNEKLVQLNQEAAAMKKSEVKVAGQSPALSEVQNG